jgi:hypothetical protein
LVEKIENGKIPSENDDVLSEKEFVKEIET